MKQTVQPNVGKALKLSIIGIIILSVLPYLAAWGATPPGTTFNGTLVNIDDLSVYLSAIRQGAEGDWLYTFNFIAEPSQPHFQYILYLMMGYISSLVGGTPLFWYNMFKVIGGAIVIMGLLRWVQILFPENQRWQITSLQLLAFGSGLGWVLVPFISPNSPLLVDINVPDWNLITPLLGSPHIIFCIGLEVIFFGILIRIEQERDNQWLILSGAVTSLGIGLIYPYHIFTVGLVTSIYMLALAFRARRILWKTWFKGFLILAPLLPLLFYFGIVSWQDPIWNMTHVNNNTIDAPPLMGMLIGTGILGILALSGIKTWLRQNRSPLIPIWGAVNFLIIYFPIPHPGKFVLGLFIPVITLAAFSLEEVVLPKLKSSVFFTQFAKLTPTPYETLRRVIIILTLPSTLLVSLWTIQNAVITKDSTMYFPNEEIQAIEWLGENTGKNDLIFASYPIGNYLPRHISGKVFVGQLFIPVDLDGKLNDLATFWDPGTPQEWRDNFLKDWNITYVYKGRFENALGGLEIFLPGEIVYEENGVTIYAAP